MKRWIGCRTSSIMAAHRTVSLSSSVLVPISVEGIVKKQHRALAKAITLVESDNPDHAAHVGKLLRAVKDAYAASAGAVAPAITPRIAISGSPGAGKSCFIEALGMYLVDKLGLTVGVIAVDPSSSVNGGSILGDKTRMENLSKHPNAFVRPSPSRGHLGGVTARAWEVMSLLECAQFDVVLVETVGVGQSEVAAKHMTDAMWLLVPPASGDELQGIKKGIVEVADLVIVTKNDGDRALLAQQTKAAYRRAVEFDSNCGQGKAVLAVSADLGVGIDTVWTTFQESWTKRLAVGDIGRQRQLQTIRHFESYFEHELVLRAKKLLRRDDEYHRLQKDVCEGQLAPREAGEKALHEVLRAL